MIRKWEIRVQSLRSLQGKQNPQGREGKTLFPLGLSTGKDIVYMGNLRLKRDNAHTVFSTEMPGIFFFFFFLLPNPENCAGAGLSHFGREFSSVRLHFLRNKW